MGTLRYLEPLPELTTLVSIRAMLAKKRPIPKPSPYWVLDSSSFSSLLKSYSRTYGGTIIMDWGAVCGAEMHRSSQSNPVRELGYLGTRRHSRRIVDEGWMVKWTAIEIAHTLRRNQTRAQPVVLVPVLTLLFNSI